jgi:peptide/nickel transport system substrate-binding protein
MQRGLWKALAPLAAAGLVGFTLPMGTSMAATPAGVRAEQFGPSTFVVSGSWPAPPEFQGNPFGDGGVGTGWPLMYDTLVQFQRHTDKFYFHLATSVQNIGNEMIVHIRPDAKWQDGAPFTARDVWAYYMLNDSDPLDAYLDGKDGVLVLNSKTVAFKFRSPAPDAKLRLYLLSEGYNGLVSYQLYGKYAQRAFDIYSQAQPAHGGEPVGAFGLYISPKLQDELNKNWDAFTQSGPKMPMGTGPYEVKSVTATQMLLVKWPGYWDAKNVHFPEVLQETIASPTQGYAALDSGQLSEYNSGQATPLDVVKSVLKGNKYLVYYHWPDVASVGLLFDQAHYPFNNLKFREAIAYAINRNAIREAVDYFGQNSTYAFLGLPQLLADRYLSSSTLHSLTTYSYDPQKAATLLKQLGWHKNGSGQWVDPQGQVPNFTIGAYSGNQEHVNAAELVAEQLTAFGLPTKVLAQNGSIYYGDAETGGTNKTGEFDMTVDWTDIAWGYSYPYYSDQETYEGFFGEVMHLPTKVVDGVTELNYSPVGPNGKPVNVYSALNQLSYGASGSRQRQTLIDDLAWIANQNVLGFDLFDNAGGLFVNTQYVSGWPFANEFAKDHRIVGVPGNNGADIEKVVTLDTGESGWELLENGALSPKG